jgi:hypothetical protein
MRAKKITPNHYREATPLAGAAAAWYPNPHETRLAPRRPEGRIMDPAASHESIFKWETMREVGRLRGRLKSGFWLRLSVSAASPFSLREEAS